MNRSAWLDSTLPRFQKLKKSGTVDVVVIGGGITGLSAAYFLKQAGKTVWLLERDRLGSGDTCCTTAHVTAVTDLRLKELVKTFGDQAARLIWNAGMTAVQAIEDIVHEHKIECQFRRIPGFLHAPLEGDRNEAKSFRAEAELAQSLGLPGRFVESVPLANKPGVCYQDQAKFHPLQYLKGLAEAIVGDGCAIFEQTEASEVTDEPLTVKSHKLEVHCDYVVIATHVPLVGKTNMASATLLQTKIAPYSTYAVRAKIPRGAWPEMSLWDTSDPYFYLRVDRGRTCDYAIFGGEDHKTGQVIHTEEQYQHLEAVLGKLLPNAVVDRHWSGQVIETNDGLPLIGETSPGQFAATGFAGNGMTFGTLAGMMARDAMLKRKNPWQSLLRMDRKKIRGGTWDYLKENVDYPYYYLKDRMLPVDSGTPRSVKRGEGKVLKVDGQQVACSRDAQGKLHTVSAVCTHMGCLVRWNHAEHTWDCPCHGSRFKPDGAVVAGPAESPLDPVKSAPAKKA